MPADFRSQVEAERPYLLRYARLQLRDTDAAEDAVQEALVAALTGGATAYSGQSKLRTWLTGILKHKIVDIIRRASREQPFAQGDEEDAGDLDALFDRRGHWQEPPGAWDNPDRALHQKQFLAALEACLAVLPVKTGQAFMMREHLGLETAEICKELDITSTHCWVLLYRARMALRLCLETNWFTK